MVLVDAYVTLDIGTIDPQWLDGSRAQLEPLIDADEAAISPIIFTELVPAPSSNFLIGAHAEVETLTLLTRDATHRRKRTSNQLSCPQFPRYFSGSGSSQISVFSPGVTQARRRPLGLK